MFVLWNGLQQFINRNLKVHFAFHAEPSRQLAVLFTDSPANVNTIIAPGSWVNHRTLLRCFDKADACVRLSFAILYKQEIAYASLYVKFITNTCRFVLANTCLPKYIEFRDRVLSRDLWSPLNNFNNSHRPSIYMNFAGCSWPSYPYTCIAMLFYSQKISERIFYSLGAIDPDFVVI